MSSSRASTKQSMSQRAFVEHSPLWTRAPARDANGKPFMDFMMLIPGLKQAGSGAVEAYLLQLNDCLKPFGQNVAYVDLNVKLNLLWVSARPVPGLTCLLVEAIQQAIPHAKVITADFNPESQRASRWQLLKTTVALQLRQRGLFLLGRPKS